VDIGTSTRSAFRYSATLSLPASAEYVRRANYGGAGGDGLIQRFGLLVWPDAPADWTNVDEYPNRAAREKAWAVWERMAKIDQTAALKLGG